MSETGFSTAEINQKDIQQLTECAETSDSSHQATKQNSSSDRTLKKSLEVKGKTDKPTKVDEQRQRPRSPHQSAPTSAGEKGSSDTERESCCAAGKKVREITSRCLSEGRKVLGDAAKIAGDYQDFAIDAVGRRIVQGRQQAEACAAKAKSSLETIASNTREKVTNSTKRLGETREVLSQQSKRCVTVVDSLCDAASVLAAQGKPRLVSAYSTGKKALRERDTQLVVSALAQVVACVLVMMTTVLQMALRNEKIKNVYESLPHLPQMLQSFEIVSVLQMTKYVPLVGHHICSVAVSFVSEVKKNMGNVDKES